jgi:hypothetical protein
VATTAPLCRLGFAGVARCRPADSQVLPRMAPADEDSPTDDTPDTERLPCRGWRERPSLARYRLLPPLSECSCHRWRPSYRPGGLRWACDDGWVRPPDELLCAPNVPAERRSWGGEDRARSASLARCCQRLPHGRKRPAWRQVRTIAANASLGGDHAPGGSLAVVISGARCAGVRVEAGARFMRTLRSRTVQLRARRSARAACSVRSP